VTGFPKPTYLLLDKNILSPNDYIREKQHHVLRLPEAELSGKPSSE